jgi:PAS domain S-box-containing protein
LNHQLVLVVESDSSQDPKYSGLIEQYVQPVGLSVSSVDVTGAVNHIKEATAARIEPAVVLIGPAIPNALAVARRIRSVWPLGQMLFVADASQLEKLQRELRHALMIGSNWSLIEISDPRLPQKIQKAVYVSQQRMRLRTTLDRANLTLAAPKPVDSIQYRRMAISEHYLANLLEQSQDAILSLDTRNTVLYWNTSAERLFQQRASSVYGTHVTELPFWSLALDSSLERIHAGVQTLTAETKCPLPGGHLDLEVLMSRVHDNTGCLVGTLLVLRDISPHNRMLEVERARRREAERTSQMKDEFLAVLSHELRTPLSAVIGRTQLLKIRHRDEPDLLSSLNVIERNAKLQAKLIEDLLDSSLVVAGKLNLELQLVPIRQLVEAAIESVRAAAEHKQIALSEVFHPVAGVVHGDPHRLQQVFINLLTNAVKFTPQGGYIEVALSQAGSRFEIAVSDNGVGIEQEYLPFVFDKFAQEDASITRRHGGLGLGLSIAKHLVKLHGGDILALSEGRNKGARFAVSLPVHGGQDAGTKRFSSLKEPEKQYADILTGRRILVVEDVADARHLVTDVLQAYGAEVVAVDSGAAALQILESFRPHVLVSDIGMPDMDGYELIEKIRAQGRSGDELPALALTAFASPADREAATLAGYQTHVAKPLIVAELTAAVARLIGS